MCRAIDQTKAAGCAALGALLIVVLTRCASFPVNEKFPYRACLYDSTRRTREGTVVMRRDDDGARLFKFDHPDEGDHGTMWIPDGDVRLRICSAAMGRSPVDQYGAQYQHPPQR